MKTASLPILLALCGCGASDSHAPLAGQWETSMELVSINGKKPTAEERAMLNPNGPRTRSMCFNGAPPRVGHKTSAGRCTFVRVDDSGPGVNRELECARPGNPGKVVTSFTGTRAPDRYAYSLTTVDRDAAGKADGLTIVTRETGRRVGDCTPKS